MKEFLPKSSRVDRISYDSFTRKLTIYFTRGGVYEYSDVPEETYIGLVNAESVGQAINATIKGVYEYKQL